MSAETSKVDPRKVFVIHGRNEKARRALFDFLRAIGLDPIEWSEATRLTGKGAPYIGQILDAAFGAAQAVVVLQTPDDVAYLHESLAPAGDPACSPEMQPRPNVLFEAGLAMGRDEDRTVIVEMGQIRVFSDIHGRHVVRLDNSLRKRQELATRLQTAGCAVRLSGTDWHDVGDLTPPEPPGGGLPLGRKLPSSAASGVPRMEARLISGGGGTKLDSVQVTNHGPGDVYEVNVTGDAAAELYDTEELPIPRLPPGKSFKILTTRSATLGSRRSSHFYVTITGKTADGTPIEHEEFVSGT